MDIGTCLSLVSKSTAEQNTMSYILDTRINELMLNLCEVYFASL